MSDRVRNADGSWVSRGSCPACRHVVDSSEGVGRHAERPPQAGDVTVCIACATPAIFTADLAMREPTAEELREILADPQARRVIAAIRVINAKEGPA